MSCFKLKKTNVDVLFPLKKSNFNDDVNKMYFLLFTFIIPFIGFIGLSIIFLFYKNLKDTLDTINKLIFVVSPIVSFFILYLDDKKKMNESGLFFLIYFLSIPFLIILISMVFLNSIPNLIEIDPITNEKIISKHLKFIIFNIELLTKFMILVFCFKNIKNLYFKIIKTIKENWLMIMIVVSIAFVVLFISNIGMNYLYDFLNIKKPDNQNTIEELFKFTGIYKILFLISLFLSIVIVAPLLEEIVFRIAIFSVFKSNFVSILISSIFFALVHINVSEISSIFLYIIPGYILSMVFSISRNNITYSWLLHLINNLVSFIILTININNN